MTSLADYACHPDATRGRLHAEPPSAGRTCFQRDRDRILHSTAFRRLEYKTQVFVNHEGDHYRNRLTHSLEVAQIARSLARNLCLNEDLAEALSLAHDLGHTPFGHAGEDALAAVMQPYGGFDHNAQSIRILTRLEQRYAAFDGLNLSWETLEGIAKHNGPVAEPPRVLAEYNAQHDLELRSHASLEAQVSALSDDIAYHSHDIDDGLRAGLFVPEDLAEVPEVYYYFEMVTQEYGALPLSRLSHEAIRRLIHAMCVDVLEESQQRIAAADVHSVAAVRGYGAPLVGFSPEMANINKHLKAFLMQRMYRHYKVNRMSSKARRVVAELFAFFLHEPDCLPTEWRAQAGEAGEKQTALVVCDYIAGMTDRYALNEHAQLLR